MIALNIGCKPAEEVCTDIQKSGLQLINAWERTLIGRCWVQTQILANAGCGQ
jgi:hypothetical protein